MSVLVDTGVIFAHHDTSAPRHEAAVEVFDELLDGIHGQPFATDYILDESVTLTRSRSGAFEEANRIAGRILGEDPFPEVFELLYVEPDEIYTALEILRQYKDHELSFTDATTIALCESRGIEAVVSFDDDFDGLVERIEG